MSDDFTMFADDLRQWGPDTVASRPAPSRAEAEAYCRRLATTHYENFSLVSWLLPRALHQHFYNVYAFCRWADDLGDEVGDAQRSLELLGWWRNELNRCYAGQARHPVFVALRSTIDEFAIPLTPFDDLISAFEQDQRVTEYDTFNQLCDYCRRSANPVGRIVLYLGRQYTDVNVAWSDSICTGLQLANFWQDVARDYALGRIYLPREDRERFGITREEYDGRRSTPAFVELMQWEVHRARDFLMAGLPLVQHVPGWLQLDIELFVQGGLKILERIERIGCRVWETRPVVTKIDKARLLLAGVVRHVGRRCRVGSRRLSLNLLPTSADVRPSSLTGRSPTAADGRPLRRHDAQGRAGALNDMEQPPVCSEAAPSITEPQ